jgi:hypothetical protein
LLNIKPVFGTGIWFAELRKPLGQSHFCYGTGGIEVTDETMEKTSRVVSEHMCRGLNFKGLKKPNGNNRMLLPVVLVSITR